MSEVRVVTKPVFCNSLYILLMIFQRVTPLSNNWSPKYTNNVTLFFHLYGAYNVFWCFLALCAKNSILDVFSLLGYMLTGIPFLLSWASFDTKVEYHQYHLYFFIYMVHPILLGGFLLVCGNTSFWWHICANNALPRQ